MTDTTSPAFEITETGTAKGDVSVAVPTRVQQGVARRVAEAKATVPEHTLSTEIDMQECVAALAPDRGGPTTTDLAIKACALALREVPEANASYRDGRVERYSRINIGVAVFAHDAVAFPTIFDADAKAIGEIAAERRALSEAVQDATLTSAQMGSATFTVQDLGALGVDAATAIVQAPQAATLALGAVAARAVVVPGGALAARPTLHATLTCDHRVLYGAAAARFLSRVRELLGEPATLLA